MGLINGWALRENQFHRVSEEGYHREQGGSILRSKRESRRLLEKGGAYR